MTKLHLDKRIGTNRHPHRRIRFLACALLACGLVMLGYSTISAITCPEIPLSGVAFTGASGFGRYARPGTSPTTYTVTTLQDYVPEHCGGSDENAIAGSLRKIIEQDIGVNGGPALINFDDELSGNINLLCQLDLNANYVRIHGQTAAGNGITIRGAQFSVIDSHDVVIRYLRFRSAESPYQPFHCQRSLVIYGASEVTYNVIIDHCSIGASQDDNLVIGGAVCHITVQNSLIGGGVYNASKAGLVGDQSGSPMDYGITLCHNLITNTFGRQFAFAGGERIDFYNNVCTNAKYSVQLSSGNGYNSPRINILHNYFRSPHEGFSLFSDPISAGLISDQVCGSPCGYLLVDDNHDSIYVTGNYYEVWDGDSYEPPSGYSQWNLTYDTEVSLNYDFNTDLDKGSIHSMWTSSDYVTPSANDMDTQVFDVVMADAGCRLPLNDPELDDYDLDLWQAVYDGEKLYPSHTDTTKNLFPGTAYDNSPAHMASGVTPGSLTLSWKQSDETDYFEVYFGEDTNGNEPPLYDDYVAGVGQGSTASVSVTVAAGKNYEWKVRSYNGCGYAQDTIRWTFSTQ